MSKAFSLLESLVALALFSLVILICSQVLMQTQKDIKIYKDQEYKQQILHNAINYLQKKLRYSLIVSIDSSYSDFVIYEIDDYFFSPLFDPWIKDCKTEKIPWRGMPKFLANFSSQLDLISVIAYETNAVVLERKIQCGIAIPIRDRLQIRLTENGDLLVGKRILMQGVKIFQFLEKAKFYSLKICSSFCQSAIFPKNEILYVF